MSSWVPHKGVEGEMQAVPAALAVQLDPQRTVRMWVGRRIVRMLATE